MSSSTWRHNVGQSHPIDILSFADVTDVHPQALGQCSLTHRRLSGGSADFPVFPSRAPCQLGSSSELGTLSKSPLTKVLIG